MYFDSRAYQAKRRPAEPAQPNPLVTGSAVEVRTGGQAQTSPFDSGSTSHLTTGSLDPSDADFTTDVWRQTSSPDQEGWSFGLEFEGGFADWLQRFIGVCEWLLGASVTDANIKPSTGSGFALEPAGEQQATTTFGVVQLGDAASDSGRFLTGGLSLDKSVLARDALDNAGATATDTGLGRALGNAGLTTTDTGLGRGFNFPSLDGASNVESGLARGVAKDDGPDWLQRTPDLAEHRHAIWSTEHEWLLTPDDFARASATELDSGSKSLLSGRKAGAEVGQSVVAASAVGVVAAGRRFHGKVLGIIGFFI